MKRFSKKPLSVTVALMAVITMFATMFSFTAWAADTDAAGIGDTGYCAVGIVDTQSKTAEVLGDNGEIVSIAYEGNDPIPGGVYGFTKSGDAYTLVEATFINGSAMQNASWALRLQDNTPAGGPDQIYTNDGVNETWYDFTDNTVVFVRYSATEWRLFKGKDVVQVSEWPCNAYFSAMDNPNGGNPLVNLMVVGSYNPGDDGDINNPENIVPATVADSFYFDPTGFGWEYGDKFIGGPEVPETGYAAVGAVDTEKGKAKVLFGNGFVTTVSFSDTAPTTGAVHSYVKKADGTYTFTLLKGNHGNSDQLADNAAWGIGVATWGGFWDAATNYYMPSSASMPVFIRYSATGWRVQTHVAPQTDHWASYAYLFTSGAQTEDGKYLTDAILVGNCNAEGIVAPSETDLVPFGGDTVAEPNVDLSKIDEEPGESENPGESGEPENPATEEESGICAVGEVKDGRAIILQADGKVLNVAVKDGAPASGELYVYTKWSDGKYSFVLAELMPGYPTSSTAAWNWAAYNYDEHPNTVYGGDDVYRTSNADTAFFVRYSETEWRLFKGADAVKGNGILFNGYMSETEDHVINYMLVGDYDVANKKIIPATAEWSCVFDENGKGWENGNITLTFAAQNVETGEQSRTVVVAIAAAAALFCLAVPFIKRRCNDVQEGI